MHLKKRELTSSVLPAVFALLNCNFNISILKLYKRFVLILLIKSNLTISVEYIFIKFWLSQSPLN